MAEVFMNPQHVEASKQWRRWEMFGMVKPTLPHPTRIDQWAYTIEGMTFTHPRYEYACKMAADPERHREVIDYYKRVMNYD